MISLLRLLYGRSEAPGKGPASQRGPIVRAMRAGDREAVLCIEAASFPDAWPAGDFDNMLAKARFSGHVLEQNRECLGFFVVARGQGFLHLANLAIAPAARRTGLGTIALRAIEKIAWAHGLPRVVLEVRETNLAAQLLYRSNGYRAVEILRSHYGDQDGYRMAKSIPLPGPRN